MEFEVDRLIVVSAVVPDVCNKDGAVLEGKIISDFPVSTHLRSWALCRFSEWWTFSTGWLCSPSERVKNSDSHGECRVTLFSLFFFPLACPQHVHLGGNADVIQKMLGYTEKRQQKIGALVKPSHFTLNYDQVKWQWKSLLCNVHACLGPWWYKHFCWTPS